MKSLTIVCTDFSSCSDQALSRTAEIAPRDGSRVLIIHVCAPQTTLAANAEPWDETPLRRLRDARHHYFRDVPDNDVQYDAVSSSHAARTICEIAQKNHASLIVLGSHGRTGVLRQLLGSVAEHVVRHAPCSVLVVRGTRHR